MELLTELATQFDMSVDEIDTLLNCAEYFDLSEEYQEVYMLFKKQKLNENYYVEICESQARRLFKKRRKYLAFKW